MPDDSWMVSAKTRKTTLPGNVVDLSAGDWSLPETVVVDTNLLVEHLLHVVPGVNLTRLPEQTRRAEEVFRHLKQNVISGIVTPTVFVELIHVAIRTRYQQVKIELGDASKQITTYAVAIKDAMHLYKQDPSILKAFAAHLGLLRRLLIARNLLVIAPEELGEIESGRSYDAELVHLIGKYGLDSNDAVILMEAQRCGVTEIVTFDRDLLRAQADFTVYTWL